MLLGKTICEVSTTRHFARVTPKTYLSDARLAYCVVIPADRATEAVYAPHPAQVSHASDATVAAITGAIMIRAAENA